MAATRPPALQAQLPTLGIGRHTILRDVDLSLPAGRWSAIVGPNGAGKSTLLRALAGLLPVRGELRLQGRPLRDWPARERARQLGWLGQGEAGGGDLRVWDVVLLGRLPHRPWLAAADARDRDAASAALRETGTWDLRERRLGTLSGGERQRVLLARLLAVQAPVLLMDEPLAHLDPPHQADWLASVRRLVAGGHTVVSVLHELNLALQADDLIIVQGGRLRHQGAAGSPDTHRALQAAFERRIAIHPLGRHWVALPCSAPPESPHAD